MGGHSQRVERPTSTGQVCSAGSVQWAQGPLHPVCPAVPVALCKLPLCSLRFCVSIFNLQTGIMYNRHFIIALKLVLHEVTDEVGGRIDGHSARPVKVRCSHYPGTMGCESLRLTQSLRQTLLRDTAWHVVSKGRNCGPGPQGWDSRHGGPWLSVKAKAPEAERVAWLQMEQTPCAGRAVTSSPDTEATGDGVIGQSPSRLSGMIVVVLRLLCPRGGKSTPPLGKPGFL